MSKKNTHSWRMPRACAVLAAALAGVAADKAGAEITEQLSYSLYVVNHQAGQSVREAMSKVTPIRENGEVFHGHTKWHVRWRFQWHADARGECRMTGNVTELSALITLPELHSTDAQARRAFTNYIAALRRHEMGHYQIAQVAARRIDEAILTLPTMPSCDALARKANEVGERFIERARQEGFDYDRDTKHGHTQGAWMPL